MLITNTSRHVYLAEGNTLKTYSLANLVFLHQTHLDAQITSVYGDAVAVVGTQSGAVYVTTTDTVQPRLLKKFGSPITALFLKNTILGVGTDHGTICVMLINGTETDVLEEREHTAPILGIATDGVDVYVSDMRNRICTFPDHKVYDNFNTYIYHSRYLFASETTSLYCKTKDAFAVCLEHSGNAIQKFVFSRKGSVLFVKEDERVIVYDFNSRTVINEIRARGDFLYDEDRNRLIVVERGELQVVENAADRNLLANDMDAVFFNKLNIEEKIVWSESESSEEAIRVKRKKTDKKRTYEFVTGADDSAVEQTRTKKKGDERPSKTKHLKAEVKPGDNALKSLFGDDAFSVDENPAVHKAAAPTQAALHAEQDVGHFMPSSVIVGTGHLMCYNAIGHLTSIKDEFFNIVELTYHDTSRRSVKIKDTNFCALGAFSSRAILLGTTTSLHFHSESIQWTYQSTEDILLLGITDTLFSVVYKRGILRIYRHSGLEIFNCEFDAIRSVFCYNHSVALLCADAIYAIECDNFTFKKFETRRNADWLYVDNDFYYRVKDRFYVVRNGLSLKVGEVSNAPLCVSGGYLVALSGTNQLYPEPAVEYFRIRLDHCSNGPNILNLTVFDRDDEQVLKAAKEAESAGRHHLAGDLRALVKSVQDPMSDNGQRVGNTDLELDDPVHYRQKENDRWATSDAASKSAASDKEAPGEIRTKRYSPFKK